MRVQSANVVDSNMVLQLLTSISSILEEVRTEPNILQLGLVRILCQNLFNGYFPLGGLVYSQPDYTEPTPTKQSNSLEVFREPFPKFVILVGSQVSSHVETFLPIPLVDLYGLLLVVLILTHVVIPFVNATQFFLGFGFLLLLPIK